MAAAGKPLKWMALIIALISGFVSGTLAIVWGTEFYLNPGDAPVAAFLLPLLLFTAIAFMSFKRSMEIVDAGQLAD